MFKGITVSAPPWGREVIPVITVLIFTCIYIYNRTQINISLNSFNVPLSLGTVFLFIYSAKRNNSYLFCILFPVFLCIKSDVVLYKGEL